MTAGQGIDQVGFLIIVLLTTLPIRSRPALATRSPMLQQLFLRATNTTASSGHLAPLDGLRAIACVCIVLLHCSVVASYALDVRSSEAWRLNPRTALFNGGTSSLDIFFLLSGFLLTSQVCQPGSSCRVLVFLGLQPLLLFLSVFTTVRFCPTSLRAAL